MSVFASLLAREARLLFRRPAELANPLVFFAIVIAMFPLAVGPESQLLQTLSPGLLWVAALLAVLLSLDGLFRSDFEDGSLEQWVLSPHPLALLVLAKVLAHWMFSGVADFALVYPGADSGQRGFASSFARHARDRLSALACQPDRADSHPYTFCNSGRPEDQCRRINNEVWPCTGQ